MPPLWGFTFFVASGVGLVSLRALVDFFNSKVIGLAELKFHASSQIADSVSALVLRSVDDEPSLMFAIGALGNRLVARALHITVFLVTLAPTLFFCWYVVASVARILFYIDPNTKLVIVYQWNPIFYTIMALIAFVFCIGPASSIILILLSGVMRSVFGRELSIGAFRQDVAFNSTLDHCGRITIKTFASSGGLRHSIYHHADCPAAIAAWVRSIGSPSPNAAGPREQAEVSVQAETTK